MEKNDLKNLLQRKVSEYMSTNVLLLREHIMLDQATSQMQRKNCDEIIVIDELSRPLGIITDEDILKKISEQYVKPLTTRVDDVMTFPLITIAHNDTLQKALDLMRKNKKRKLAVTSDYGKVIGIIFQKSIADVIRNSISIKKPIASTFSGVLWNLGSVLQFAGILMLIPSILSTILGETDVATGIFLMSTLLLISGFLLNSYGNRQPLNIRGMSILVFSSFVILVMFGSIPYLYISPYGDQSFTENLASSIFSSSAAFTTSGVSLFSTPEDLPQSFTFYRGFSQFVGGLSFIYLIMTAFYPEEKLHTMHGFISGQTPRLKELFGTITIIFSIYAVIIAILLYYFGSENIIDNFSLAMSTLSTGGFLPDSQIFSKIGFGGDFVLMAGMILGTLPFAFHYGFVRKKFLSAKLSSETMLYLGFLAVGVTMFVIATQGNVFEDSFTVIAASTTAGFQIVDMSTLEAFPKLILTIMMLVGGCGFSTAGGIKIFRLVDIFKMRKMFSRKQWAIALPDKKNEFLSILAVMLLFPTIPLLGALYLSSEGYNFYDSYFETIGAITTAGLGSGILGPHLDPIGKIIASFLMILGRLEIIIIVFMFLPKFVNVKKETKKNSNLKN